MPDDDVHYRMDIYGHYAYLVENRGLRIVDIADPANMQDEGFYTIEMGNGSIAVYGHYLYVRCSGYGADLVVLDIADPLNPQEVRRANIGATVWMMKTSGDKLFAAAGSWLSIYNADTFDHLSTIELAPADAYINDIEISGNYVFMATHDHGLYVYDISDPQNPVLGGYTATPTYSEGVCVVDQVAIVADSTNLGFYDCSEVMTGIKGEIKPLPGSFALLANYPNPFNASTNINFELPTAGYVSLDIFDVLGRRVTSLVSSEFAAGRHTITWNGIDNSGQTVASGRYYIKLISDSRVATRPIMLLK
jgi:hypothetical protein